MHEVTVRVEKGPNIRKILGKYEETVGN